MDSFFSFAETSIANEVFFLRMENKKQFDFDIFKRVLKLANPYKGILFFCAFLAVVLAPITCLLYTSPSPRDKRQSRMPSSA